MVMNVRNESRLSMSQNRASSPLQEPVITTTRPLLPPSQQHNTIDSSELPEADMKEILHQRMFESGSYKSLPEHVALYEALEASMKRENRDEFLAEKDNHVNDAVMIKIDLNLLLMAQIKARSQGMTLMPLAQNSPSLKCPQLGNLLIQKIFFWLFKAKDCFSI
uniref:Uncharacterized protein n=1 Tax=Tanacetum cinerariifolium TaxID=118510 RepID=A0A6L2K0P6_TANCI|nr:hypothetical protein [Tanacetum cinerariifolium]GEX92296.1 hypothetical protein [Tanacetum cinerariifolium]